MHKVLKSLKTVIRHGLLHSKPFCRIISLLMIIVPFSRVVFFFSIFSFVCLVFGIWSPCQIARCMRFNIHCATGQKLYYENCIKLDTGNIAKNPNLPQIACFYWYFSLEKGEIKMQLKC